MTVYERLEQMRMDLRAIAKYLIDDESVEDAMHFLNASVALAHAEHKVDYLHDQEWEKVCPESAAQ